jgi:hypothetical protein
MSENELVDGVHYVLEAVMRFIHPFLCIRFIA